MTRVKFLFALSALLLPVITFWAFAQAPRAFVPATQIPGAPRYTTHHPMQRPGSNLIPRTHPVVLTGNSTGGGFTVLDPIGAQIHIGGRAVFVLKVTGAPSGGSGQLLYVNLQSSCDDGQTWTDFAAFASPSGTGSQYFAYSAVCSPSNATQFFPVLDGNSTFPFPGSAYQGPLGNRLRVRYYDTLGTGTNGPWAFQVFVLPHLNPNKDHMQ
jgi:hypothetical protein